MMVDKNGNNDKIGNIGGPTRHKTWPIPAI